MKISKLLIIYIFIIWPIIMFSLYTVITGKVCISYNGFAIDDYKNLYLGKNSTIEVLDSNGKFLRNISSYTSRGYKFTITADNNIKIDTGDYLYMTDLKGNLIERKEFSDNTEDELIDVNKYKYTSSDGVVYVMKNRLFRTHIYQLDETRKILVYKMPVFDYIIKLLCSICSLSMMIVIPTYIVYIRKRQ